MSAIFETDDKRVPVTAVSAPDGRTGRDGKRVVPSSQSWPESLVRGLEQVFESGDLDWTERLLDSERTSSVAGSANPEAVARIEAVRSALPAARAREAASGGKGSLIDPGHSMTLFALLPPGGPTYVAVRHAKGSWRHAAAMVSEGQRAA